MRLRLLAAMAALLLSSGVAFADTGSGVGTAVRASGGVIAAGAGAGAIAVVANMFGNGNKGEALAVTRAPEISTTGTTAGLILLVGGILVLRGRQRAQSTAE